MGCSVCLTLQKKKNKNILSIYGRKYINFIAKEIIDDYKLKEKIKNIEY